jgi:hypothetical protein
MGPFSNYDITRGLERVILLYLVVTIAFLGLLSIQLYKSLQQQDSSLARGATTDIRSQTLLIVKRAILWIFGYKGEDREKTPFNEVDINWVIRNRSAIILRLAPIYGLYILTLVVLTRPVYFDGNGYHVFNYSTDLHELFALFIGYVSCNLLFDYFSLKSTFSFVMRAIETKKYVSLFAQNAMVAVALFLISQIVSCVFWVYKRQDPSFPTFSQNAFHNILEVALWPYAFVTGQGSSQIISDLFPGQLLITGTVFIPTMTLVLLFIVFSLFLKLTETIKTVLLSHKLDRFCRLILRVQLVGLLEPSRKLKSFGYCNLAFLALLNLSLVSMAGAIVARIF